VDAAACRGVDLRPPCPQQRLGQRWVRRDALIRTERPRGAVGADRLARDDQVAEREPGSECAAGAGTNQAPSAECDQLGQDDRRRGTAHAGRLDRERLAVRDSGARVAPQAAVVVEHQRLDEQRLRERQGAPGVAGQQHPLGQRRGGVQVDRLGIRRRGGGVGLGLRLRHGPRL
jgi:hypothetical protein